MNEEEYSSSEGPVNIVSPLPYDRSVMEKNRRYQCEPEASR